MNQSLTSLVINAPYSKQLGLPHSYYRWRSCNPNFPDRTQTSVGGFTPADQYQKLKLIQNTVRVYGSLYTSNLGPLSAYKKPLSNPENGYYGVCWNQMSDRPVPSVQPMSIPTGYKTAMNRRHTSVTSSKPGSQTPGGKGCDIKHNSYERYLNRLKGKGPMRRGVIPSNFGNPIPFNNAFPVYGGKTTKTNIVNGCDCPIGTQTENNSQNIKIYDNPLSQPYPVAIYEFKVGSYVYAIEKKNTYYSRALITNIENGVYTVKFDDGIIQEIQNESELRIFYPCNCNSLTYSASLKTGVYGSIDSVYNLECTTSVNNILNNYTYF
jgi:hypothetical protein